MIGDPVNKMEYDNMMGPLYNGYVPVRVEEDGNCLFHSFAYLSGESHVDLRRKTVEWIIENADSDPLIQFYAEELDLFEHLQRMSMDGEWGTDLEIYALSKLLGVTTVLYDVKIDTHLQKPLFTPIDAFNPTGPTKQYTLCVLNKFDKARAHFVPLAEEGQVVREDEGDVVKARQEMETQLTGQAIPKSHRFPLPSSSPDETDDSWRYPNDRIRTSQEATLDEMIAGLEQNRTSPTAMLDAARLRELKRSLGGRR